MPPFGGVPPSRGCLLPGVPPSSEGLLAGGYLLAKGASLPGDPTLCTEFLTHASKNIILPQTSFAGGNNMLGLDLGLDHNDLPGTINIKLSTL